MMVCDMSSLDRQTADPLSLELPRLKCQTKSTHTHSTEEEGTTRESTSSDSSTPNNTPRHRSKRNVGRGNTLKPVQPLQKKGGFPIRI